MPEAEAAIEAAIEACTPSAFAACPPLDARGARWAGQGRQPHSMLYPAPAGLHGAVVAVVCRDTRGVVLDDAQRLSHFPATPMVCLSWYQDMAAGLVGVQGCEPFEASVMLSGSQTAPTASWASGPGSLMRTVVTVSSASSGAVVTPQCTSGTPSRHPDPP